MKLLIATLLLISPFFGFSQFFGISAAYTYDGHIGTAWRHSRGVQLGVGAENYVFASAPLSLSVRYYGAFMKSRFNTTVNDIEFDLPDSIENTMGYANIDYKKFSFGVEADLGYQDWEYTVIEPYASLGARYQSHGSWLNYELYEPDDCMCYDTRPDQFTETKTFGFTLGGGFKIRPTETFYIDLRATYHGGWGLESKGSNPHLPNTDSFHINSAGTPTVTYSPKRYVQGMNFNVGVIFNLRWNRSEDNTFSFFNDDDDDSDDTEYESDSNSSDTRDCDPVTLTPKGRDGD